MVSFITHRLLHYWRLTKPGILISNALTVPAGYFLAANPIHWPDFWAVLSGSTLIIASACALNNYLDQDIDRLMDRTKQRPLIQGQITGLEALIISIVLGIAGVVVLFFYSNLLVLATGVIGFIVYVWLYGAWSKRQSLHGTLVGSISGAAPILAGYLAATGVFDLGALLVFLILFLWQQPEFYSISIYRRTEYQAAGIPVISVVKGDRHAQIQILAYIAAFALAHLLLGLFDYAGLLYTSMMLLASLVWFAYGFFKLSKLPTDQWARHMFRGAMYIILLLCLGMPFANI